MNITKSIAEPHSLFNTLASNHCRLPQQELDRAAAAAAATYFLRPTTAAMGNPKAPAVSERVKLGNERIQTGPRILICPSGFKESLGPNEVADCIEAGVLRAVPDAFVTKAPMVDGGEGFTEALVASTGGRRQFIEVTGPVREPISSHYGFLGSSSKSAVVEMAAAAGLSLVPRDQRNPLHTTTFGVGQLIKAALDDGATSILLGCGDSGTCDGGIGMAQALGARFFDSKGVEIPQAMGGASLNDLATADLSGLHPRLRECEIDVACNWHNVLCGPKGVARVFGPQKVRHTTPLTMISRLTVRYRAPLQSRWNFSTWP